MVIQIKKLCVGGLLFGIIIPLTTITVAQPSNQDLSKIKTNTSASIKHKRHADLFQTIKYDFQTYYSAKTFKILGTGYMTGALLANSNVDQSIQNTVQSKLRGSSSDYFASIVKPGGNQNYTVPFFIAIHSLFPKTSKLNQWSRLSMRSMIVGSPPMLMGQLLTGASRPSETKYDSQWRPLNDDNGVSGHAFVGAIPFFTAAKFFEDRPALKSLTYMGSLLVGWSRINDDRHYFSQVLLGVLNAWISVEAVYQNNDYNISASSQKRMSAVQINSNYTYRKQIASKSFVIRPLMFTSFTGVSARYHF